MMKIIVVFLALVSILGLVGVSYIRIQMPPSTSQMYALTAKQNEDALYKIYADDTLPPETREFAIVQYLFLIEDDATALQQIESELARNRDQAPSADLKQIYLSGLSRLNRELIQRKEKELINRIVKIIGRKDTNGDIHLTPAPKTSKSPPSSVPVDILMIAQKVKKFDLAGDRIHAMIIKPGFRGLSAAEISQFSRRIDKVGLILSQTPQAINDQEDCRQRTALNSASLYAVTLKSNQLITSQDLAGDKLSGTGLTQNALENDCADIGNYFLAQRFFSLSRQ